MANSLYEVKVRRSGFANIVSLVITRGEVSTQGVEKVIPPVLEYNEDGSFKYISTKEVLDGIIKHPYVANSFQFNAERLADLEVAALYKHLEHFPSLVKDSTGVGHTLAEYIYSHQIYLKPSPELAEKLKPMDFIEKGKFLSAVFVKLKAKYDATYSALTLDFHSVPKKKIGTFCYIAKKEDKIGIVPKVFGFGMEKAIPTDRLAREISSFKASERFINPVPVEGLLETVKPFVTKLRVAIVGTETSMLDGADIYASAIPKLACKLTREKILADPSTLAPKDRNLKYIAFRSGINVVHSESVEIDETKVTPGTVRLVFPGGVKVAGQVYEDYQAYTLDNQKVDVLMDFRTFAAKGAVAAFALMKGKTNLTPEESIEFFKSLKKEVVYLNGVQYEGYVGELPAVRPGQRYTELSKPSRISFDMIALAITKRKFRVSKDLETEYSELRTFRNAINRELIKINGNS